MSEKAMAPHSSTLASKIHGRRSPRSPWGRWGLDMTERLHFHFSLSCIGERNGNPLRCSCLENPRDGGAWWAAVYAVAQSQTQLKWLSSSSRILINNGNLLLIVLEVGSPRSRHWDSNMNPLPSTLMSHCILTWQKWGGSSLGSLL